MFELQHGIRSPRDNTVNWRPYEVYETAKDAKKEARKNKGLWRIVEYKVIWHNQVNREKRHILYRKRGDGTR